MSLMHFIVSKARRLWRCLTVGLCLMGFLTGAWAFNLPPTWRWSNPQPNGANLFGLTYANGTYIEIGERGQMFVSSDGQTWYPQDTGVTNSLRAVTFLGGRLVITGENGAILISDDLVNFYSASQSTTDWLEGVAASTNLVVAVGDNAAIYTSTNAVNWTRQSVSFNNWLTGIAYGTNTFVAVGESGLIATSANGTTWVKRTSGTTTNLNSVAWSGDRFLAVGSGGNAFSSPNGSTWTAVTTGLTNELYVAQGTNNSRIVAGSLALQLQESANYSNQISATLAAPAPSWTYFTAAWNGSNYLVAGLTGLIVESYKTNNATGWKTGTNSYRSWLWQVSHAQNQTQTNYIAVGNCATILTSPNGIDWDVELPPNSATNAVFLGVGGGTNLTLIVGSQGTVLWATNHYLWNAVSPAPTTNDLQGIWYDGTRYLLCGGNGTILASTNGTNWTARTTPTNVFLMSFAQTSNNLVAVGDKGVILTSNNSTNWTRQTSGTTNWLSQVRYLNNTLITVGQNGAILTSTNGTNWSTITSGTTAWLNAVDYVNGAWFIAGNQGTMLISTNGTNWTNYGTITKKSLYGLAGDNGQLVAVGVDGVIIRSQVIPATSPVNISQYSRKSGQNIFLFTGKADQRFYLQNTNRLVSSTTNAVWMNGPQLEFFDSTETLLYLDASQTNASPPRFYRTATAN